MVDIKLLLARRFGLVASISRHDNHEGGDFQAAGKRRLYIHRMFGTLNVNVERLLACLLGLAAHISVVACFPSLCNIVVGR
jgi:hypothetical protein